MPFLYWFFRLRIFTPPFSIQSLGLQNAKTFLESRPIARIVQNLDRWHEDILWTQLAEDFVPLLDQCSLLRKRKEQLVEELKKHQAWLSYIEAFFTKQSQDAEKRTALRKQALNDRAKAAVVNLLPSTWQEWFLLGGVSVLLTIGIVHTPFGLDLNQAIRGCLKGNPIIIAKTTLATFLALVVAVITKTFLAKGLADKDKRQARLTLAFGVFAMMIEAAINYRGALDLFSASELELLETRFTALGISVLGTLMNYFWASITAQRMKDERLIPAESNSALIPSPSVSPDREQANPATPSSQAIVAYRESSQVRTNSTDGKDYPKDETELFQEMEALKRCIADAKKELRKIDLTLKGILEPLHARLGVWFFKYHILRILHSLRGD